MLKGKATRAALAAGARRGKPSPGRTIKLGYVALRINPEVRKNDKTLPRRAPRPSCCGAVGGGPVPAARQISCSRAAFLSLFNGLSWLHAPAAGRPRDCHTAHSRHDESERTRIRRGRRRASTRADPGRGRCLSRVRSGSYPSRKRGSKGGRSCPDPRPEGVVPAPKKVEADRLSRDLELTNRLPTICPILVMIGDFSQGLR